MTRVRLGEILIERGILTRHQVHRVVERQKGSAEPFGVIVENMYGIDPVIIEEAWANQYARITRRIDPRTEAYDTCALELVSRRQAWQFRVLPIRFDGPELMVATIEGHLRRALRFATNVIGIPVYLVLATNESLGEAMSHHYPLPGMSPRSLEEDRFREVLRRD